ncbi:unnamed protein product [Adineta ricciae]|uniref:Uncharacterized protein n=1 Tax=Adineta ricciae TaxID=249248 RepID=A0A814BAR8_ADIRI|nr:unnamed protein product [Adineta ricciae]
MARTNLSVMPDVNVCLRDAMDAMFNNGNQNRLENPDRTIMTSEENDVIVDIVNDDDDQQPMTDALQSSINKRKLTNTNITNHEQQNHSENDNAKRMCMMNGSH